MRFKIERLISKGGKMKHTKGPWRVESRRELNGITINQFPSGMRVCFIENSGDKKTDQSDAKLISYAPEMLEMLKLAAEECEGSQVYVAIMLLLEKIEGRKK